MKWFEGASLLLAILFVPAIARAQGQMAAEVEPMADQIVCPLEELEWGIAQSFPDPWYSTPQVVTEAELTAIPTQKTTTCLTTVRFEGRIHVNGSGLIRYRVEENGQAGPLKTIDANAAGGYALAWQSEVEAPEEPAAAGGLVIASQPGNVATGRARLLIESPSDGVAESNEASYEITCSALAPVGGLAQTPEETEPEPLGIAAPQQPPQEATPQIRRAAPQPEPVVEGGQNEMIHKQPTRGAAPASADNALQAGQDAWTTVQADMPVMSAQHVYARVDDPDRNKESDEGNNGHQLK